MPRIRSALAALGLVATCLVAVTARPAPADQGPLPPAKPFSAGSVALDAGDIADGELVATTAPLPGLDEPRVVFEGTGDAEVVGTDSPATPDSPLPSTVTATVEVAEVPRPDDPAEAVLADASRSTVVATLRATSPEGVVLEASDTVWVDEFRGELLASEEGELDLRLQRVDVLEADGIVTPQEADGLRELAQGAGAETVQSVVAGACVGVCVSGTVRWTDSTGTTHPVDRAAVQIRDDDGALDETVTIVTTDADGEYSATIDNADGDATGRDVYIRVLADGPGFTLDHHVDGAVAVDVADGSQLTQDVTADNVEDNNTAFSVRAGLVIAHDAVAELRGGALPAIAVVFPDALRLVLRRGRPAPGPAGPLRLGRGPARVRPLRRRRAEHREQPRRSPQLQREPVRRPGQQGRRHPPGLG